MNIASVQKRKFLNNLYKLYYSSGKEPSEHDVRTAFNQYFKINKFGQPVEIDTSELQINQVTNPNALNELMINTLLNLEILYDCVMESNQEIFGVVNYLNNKIENLKAKRKELESKIDQLLFANSNTDGFFFSYLENFNNLSNIEMGMSTAFIDVLNNNVKIPKIVSQLNNQQTSLTAFSPASVTHSITYNNVVVVNENSVSNFDLIVDGLNDTAWSKQYQASAPGIVALSINIPISVSSPISKFEGSIISISPCSIFVRAIPADPKAEPIIKAKDSTGDYNRFSFVLPAKNYSSIILTMFKNEPDRVISSETTPYLYEFGIRELVTSAEYYEERAQVVSRPISVPTNDNRLLSISAVSLEANHQMVPGTKVSYFVAQDVVNATSVADFDWISIEPTNLNNNESPKLVNLIGSTVKSEIIDSVDVDSAEPYDYELIPLNLTSSNVNELNPNALPFNVDKEIYRVARVDSGKKYLQPYLLANLDTFKYYSLLNINYSKVESFMYRSLEQWGSMISAGNSNELSSGQFINNGSNIVITRNEPHSGLIETKLFCTEERSVSEQVSKILINNNDITLAIYLNGILIADLPAGRPKANIDWNFVKGINNIAILYDKNFSGRPSIDLMGSRNLADFGTVFLDYFPYLDPIEFGRRVSPNDNSFTITNFYGVKEILASRQITSRTILRYYSDVSDAITAVRYRIDLERYANPLQTPAVDAIRLKFKHNDF